jgi:molecular chaperone HtpG
MTESTVSSSNASAETLGFQTEVKQLLRLMIHSLYSNREIFLRELISNASDACDKLRFQAIDAPHLWKLDAQTTDSELAIEVSVDKAARTITIRDNGIGMSREEAIQNLGTIARSGTREFFSNLSGDQARDAQLIGQFGVGFYSSFIVAEKVEVRSRRAGMPAEAGVLWTSAGEGDFQVESITWPRRGTSITLHLRAKGEGDDAESFDDLLQPWKLRDIITRYSDHISIPIRMEKEEWDAQSSAYKATGEWETVNQASALWTRSKSEITPEQYNEFYRHISRDQAEPLATTHNRVEGRSEYTQLLFIPSKAPFDLWDRQQRRGLKLYVKRVFIMDDAEQLLPAYLRFVRGVIDSSDLPLNVSREILQESRDVRAIREGTTKRVLGMIEDLAQNKADEFKTFWSAFGQVLKEGVGEDFANQERLLKLIRFASTHSGTAEQTVSLADYIGRMKEGQTSIYYVTGETYAAASGSPHLEVFKAKGVEVLVLTDRVDEWMLSFVQEFDGKPLVSVARGGLDLGELEDAQAKAEAEKVSEQFKPLAESVKSALGEKVKDVRITHRLTDSPACLVADEGEISGHLERLLKQAGQAAPERRPILELNPKHPLVAQLQNDPSRTQTWAPILFDQALLAEGGQLADPAGFVKRLNDVLVGLSLR